MQRLLTVHIGGCGVGLGTALWGRLIAAHGIGQGGRYSGSAPPELLFETVGSRRVVPRCVFIDPDPSQISSLSASAVGALCRADDVHAGEHSCNRRYARGRAHTLVKSSLPSILQRMGAAPRALLVTCGLAGGTGGGLTAALVADLRKSAPDAVILVAAAVTTTTANPLEIYNQVLGLASLQRDADLVVLLEDGALAALSAHGAGEAERNAVAAEALTTLLHSMCSSAGVPLDPRELAATLAPRATLKIAGLTRGDGRDPLGKFGLGSLSGHRWSDGALLSELWVVPPTGGLDGAALWRDPRARRPGWRPPNLRITSGPAGSDDVLCAACHTGLAEPLASIRASFDALLRRRAFLDQLAAEGVSGAELATASAALSGMLAELGAAAGEAP